MRLPARFLLDQKREHVVFHTVGARLECRVEIEISHASPFFLGEQRRDRRSDLAGVFRVAAVDAEASSMRGELLDIA